MTDGKSQYKVGDQVFDNWSDAWRTDYAADRGLGYNTSTDKYTTDGKEFDSSFGAENYVKSKTDTSKAFSIGDDKYAFAGKEYDNWNDAYKAQREHNAVWKDSTVDGIEVRHGAETKYRVGDKTFTDWSKAYTADNFNDAISGNVPQDSWRRSAYSGGTYIGDINGDGTSEYFKNGNIYSGISDTRNNANPIGSTTGNIQIQYDGTYKVINSDKTFDSQSAAQHFYNTTTDKPTPPNTQPNAIGWVDNDNNPNTPTIFDNRTPAQKDEEDRMTAAQIREQSRRQDPRQEHQFGGGSNDYGNRQGSGTGGRARSGEFVSNTHDWSAAYGGKVPKYNMGGPIRKKNCDWSV